MMKRELKVGGIFLRAKIIVRDERPQIPAYVFADIKKLPSQFCHEVIDGSLPRKIAFDIDYETTHNEAEFVCKDLLEEIKNAICITWNKEYYAYTNLLFDIDSHLIIMTSNGPKNDEIYKVSYHILKPIICIESLFRALK